MSFTSTKCLTLRHLAAGGVLLGALAAAGPASAALGTAPPAQFTNRPNLQSVTFDDSGIVGAFKFDRPVQLAGGTPAQEFKFGGYQSSVATAEDQATAVNVSTSDPTTVLVTFADDSPDFDNQTFGTVAAGAVRGNGTQSATNFADSTRVTGAGGESGTRGHTSGPDLESVIVDSDQNRIIYTFDQAEDGAADTPGSFGFVDANGDAQRGTNVVDESGASVTVQFQPGAITDVDNARQAFYGPEFGFAARKQARAGFFGDTVSTFGTQGRSPGAPAVSVPIPGKDGDTSAPVLLSAALEIDSGTIVYTFDKPVGAVSNQFFNGFLAVESNGDIGFGQSATIVGGNQVRVTFNTSQFTEHIVFASVLQNSVVGPNGNSTNAPTGKPVGGNGGAKATGYTTAPDAISATINKTTGQATVLFDSRFAANRGGGPAVTPGAFQLLANDGTVIGGAPSTATADQATTPIQARVILQFTPQQVAAAAAIRVGGYVAMDNGGYAASPNGFAVTGTITGGFVPDARNVETVIVPTATTRKFAAK